MRIFLDSAETIYCFPIALNPNFKFFLKSMNLKEFEISSIIAISPGVTKTKTEDPSQFSRLRKLPKIP